MLLNTRFPIYFMLKQVKYDLLFVIIVGFAVHFLTTTFADVLPEMPLSVPAFLGTAISVLLSFKMNQSYDRWWEARKVWGAIVNDSRTFTRQLQTFVADSDVVKRMTYRQIAWCYSLGQSLRKLEPLQDTDSLLADVEMAYISKQSNKPLAILNLNAQELKGLYQAGTIEMFPQVQIDNTLSRLTDSMGMAERIKNTVFPVTYRLFLHLTIYLFVIILSIALNEVDTYFEIPLLTILSMLFFVMEKASIQLQDPFNNMPTDTNVTAIARTIEINLKQMLDDIDVPEPMPEQKYYIM